MPTKKTSPKVLPYDGNMAFLKIGYEKYVMPYADGITLMKCMEKVEMYKEKYADNTTIETIIALPTNEFSLSTLSKEKYLELKMNQLLGVDNE